MLESLCVAVSFTVILSVLVLNAITECHRRGGLNHRDLFSTGLEARKSKITEPADLVSGENVLSQVSSQGREAERASSSVSPVRGTLILQDQSSTLMTSFNLVSLLQYITWVLELNI